MPEKLSSGIEPEKVRKQNGKTIERPVVGFGGLLS